MNALLKDKVHEITFSPKQMTAFNALESDGVDELLYGGAKGGGKTVFGCQWAFYKVKQLAQFFKLSRSEKPPVLGYMGRKQGVDFNSTTLVTWQRDIPSDAYTINKQEKLITIEGLASIRYGGMDDTDTIKKFNSAEFAFYFVDQAEEVSETDIGMLRGAMRFQMAGLTPKYKGLLTANPALCWLKPGFITNPQPRTKFIQALPKDNPFLPSNYLEQLRKAYSFNPSLLSAYLDGLWDELDQAFVVIPYKDVAQCVNNFVFSTPNMKRITVCDVAESGEDETVIYDFENYKVVNEEIYAHRDLMDTTGRLQAHAKKNGSNMICVDKVGIGAGVYARLQEIFGDDQAMTIYGFDGRVSPPEGLDKITYKNYKTYAWFKAAELLKEKRCSLPDDQALTSQLASVTYHFTSGEVLALDSKDGLKAKIKRSPDRADAFVMGLDALTKATPIKKRDAYAESHHDYQFRPDAV